MKKTLVCCAGIIAAFVLTGCISQYAVAHGFPTALPGALIAATTHGGFIGNKLDSMKDVEVLGPVSAEVSTTNTLLLISAGDASIARAKQLALRQYPTADDVVNVEIDVKHTSVLSMFNTATMYYRGIAIKYKK